MPYSPIVPVIAGAIEGAKKGGAMDDDLEHVRVAVIGSGFGGLGAAVRLRREGITDFVVLERADAVGGTWRDNSYPGLRLRRALPPVLLLLRAQPRLAARLLRAAAHPRLPGARHRHLRAPPAPAVRRRGAAGRAGTARRGRWHLTTARGELTADVVVSATGPLSDPQDPGHPRDRGLPRPGLPLLALGPRLRPDGQAGRRWSAPAPPPSRSCRPSSRDVAGSPSSSAPRRG